MFNGFMPFPYSGLIIGLCCMLGMAFTISGFAVRDEFTGEEVRRRWFYAAAAFLIPAIFLMNWSSWRFVPVLIAGIVCALAAKFFNEKRSSYSPPARGDIGHL